MRCWGADAEFWMSVSEVLLQVKLASPESGKHLLEAEELLQTHRLLEADMAVQAEKIRDISAAALRFADAEGKCARISLHPMGWPRERTLY